MIYSLLFSIGLLLNPNYQQTIYKSEAQQVYQTLKISSGFVYDFPYELNVQVSVATLSGEDFYNAWSSVGLEEIGITYGYIQSTKSPDELAFTLGHEMAHYLLKHTNSSEMNEAQADALGSYFAIKAGYNPCAGYQFRLRQLQERGDFFGKDHPGSSYRANLVKFPWCK